MAHSVNLGLFSVALLSASAIGAVVGIGLKDPGRMQSWISAASLNQLARPTAQPVDVPTRRPGAAERPTRVRQQSPLAAATSRSHRSQAPTPAPAVTRGGAA